MTYLSGIWGHVYRRQCGWEGRLGVKKCCTYLWSVSGLESKNRTHRKLGRAVQCHIQLASGVMRPCGGGYTGGTCSGREGGGAQDPEVGKTLLSALIIWGDRAWVHAIEQVSSGVQVWGYLSEKVCGGLVVQTFYWSKLPGSV